MKPLRRRAERLYKIKSFAATLPYHLLVMSGVNVTGATASTTITTATTEVRSLSFQTVVRTFNNVGIDSLSVVNSGLAATFSNISVSVIKL